MLADPFSSFGISGASSSLDSQNGDARLRNSLLKHWFYRWQWRWPLKTTLGVTGHATSARVAIYQSILLQRANAFRLMRARSRRPAPKHPATRAASTKPQRPASEEITHVSLRHTRNGLSSPSSRGVASPPLSLIFRPLPPSRPSLGATLHFSRRAKSDRFFGWPPEAPPTRAMLLWLARIPDTRGQNPSGPISRCHEHLIIQMRKCKNDS